MVVIAIDGPAGAGKSTVTRRLASELGVPHLDSGAMYRAVAWAALDRDIDPADTAAVARLAEGLVLDVGERVTVDGTDVTEAIRGPDVNAAVSVVAANRAVRRVLVERQRAWVAAHGAAVVEGRDIGTVVIPDAPLKVFLTARPEVRAARRHDERPADQTLDAVAAGMAERDELDSNREASPLRAAPDAVEIDTSDRDVDEIVAELAARARAAMDAGRPVRERPEIEVSGRGGEVWRPAGTGFFSGEGLVARWFYAAVAASLRGFFHLWFRIGVDHPERVPATGPFVLAPVHRSNLDTVLMAMVPRRLRFMGKDSLWKVKAAAWLVSALGGYPVNRSEADRDALAHTIEFLAAGEPVVLFPEGTRKSGPRVQPLFDGAVYVAARTQVPIVPVGIGGSERAMGRGSRFIRPVRIHIVIGQPIAPPTLKASGRVPRRAVQQASDELREILQQLYDEAQVRAGT
jgi:cytidylate kinase